MNKPIVHSNMLADKFRGTVIIEQVEWNDEIRFYTFSKEYYRDAFSKNTGPVQAKFIVYPKQQQL